MDSAPHHGTVRRLCDVIETGQARILELWGAAVRKELTAASELPEVMLRDNIPSLLHQLASIVRSVHEGGNPTLEDLPAIHALARLDAGFSLRAVVKEMALLRTIILHVWREEVGATLNVDEVDRLNEAIDDAIAQSVVHFAEARDRTLRGLDRLSAAALGTGDIETFLPGLIAVLQQTSAACDTVTILLREEDNSLRVRATVGLEADLAARIRLRIGEGFSGTIAATGQPLMLRHAAADPLIVSDHVRRMGLRALYGVPLEHEGKIIGVAHFGSLTAFEFSLDDQQLFRTMARRATSLIVQAQLMDSERVVRKKFEALADSIPQLAWMADDTGAIFWSNQRWFEFSGKSPGESVGEGWQSALHPEHAARVVKLRSEHLKAGEPWEDTFPLRRRDGQYRWFLSRAVPIRDDKGRIRRWVGTATDVTEQRESTDELRRGVDFKDRFVGIVSHDLRNPLNAIKVTASTMLKQAAHDERLHRGSLRILNASDRMTTMINELLDFVRGRLGGGIPVNPVPADMGTIAAAVVEDFRAAHPDRQFQFETEGDVRGEWDPARVSQVVGNLLANALSHGARDAAIRVFVGAEGPEVVLAVRNEGPVISPDGVETLFDPFRKGRQSSQTGLGLGLYIVKEIVAAHRATVQVVSTRKEGTTFKVRWPRAAPRPAEPH